MTTSHRDVLEMAERLEPEPLPVAPRPDPALADAARAWAHSLVWLPSTRESDHFAQRLAALKRRLEPLLTQAEQAGDERLPEDLQWMHDNVRLVRATQVEVQQSAGALKRVPHVRTPE